MSTNNLPTPIVNLNYDGIVASIQQFLQSQNIFSDYDFQGSGLSVLINMLAYNTQYLNYYLQMVSNEMFLDSADLRQSVCSLANMLGYTPYSRHASSAIINIVVTPPSSPTPPATLILPAYTAFTTTINNTSYTFQTTETYTVNLDVPSQTYIFNNIPIYEGAPFTFSSTYNSFQIPSQTFIIPNSNIDTNQLIVRVQNSIGDTTLNVYTLATDITQINGTSLVYFLKEVADQQYQIFFGDGVIGNALVNGNIVLLTYLACNADAPNGANLFTASAPINGFSNIAITTVNPASGGSERESIESVRFSAPLNYTAQNRAVTQQDYLTLIQDQFPNAQSISVWGGEDNNPPIYGKVFISIQPVDNYVITNIEQQSIINSIQQYNMLTVIPEFVSPNEICILINTIVKYDPTLTTKSANQIQNLVAQTIQNYNSSEINKFNKMFRYSNLCTQIDATDPSINNNITYINIQRRLIPILGQVGTYSITFYNVNPIIPGSITSSLFTVTQDPMVVNVPGAIYGFDDDSNGNMRLYRVNGTEKIYVKLQAGTVDYVNANITLNNFIPNSIVSGEPYININAAPVENDVAPYNNTLVVIFPNNVTINVISEPR